MRHLRPLQTLLLNGATSLTTEALRQKLLPHAGVNPLEPEYPIFLMHGLMGLPSFSFLNQRLFDYFNGADQALRNAGYHVYSPTINPTQSPTIRAQTWADELDRALRKSGTKKVHIITHGQAAIDVKILACRTMMRCDSMQGEAIQGLGFADKIASITTLGGPHLGTPIADSLLSGGTSPCFTDLLDYMSMAHRTTSKQIKGCFEHLSTDFIVNTFNTAMQIPTHIPCYLVAANPVIANNTNTLLDRTWQAIRDIAEHDGGGDNDGFVPLRSALYEGSIATLANGQQKQWRALGQITTDHFGLAGLTPRKTAQFNYLAFMIGLAQHNDLYIQQHTQMHLLTNGYWQRKSNAASSEQLPTRLPQRKYEIPEA